MCKVLFVYKIATFFRSLGKGWVLNEALILTPILSRDSIWRFNLEVDGFGLMLILFNNIYLSYEKSRQLQSSIIKTIKYLQYIPRKMNSYVYITNISCS